jgi:hypothetical protein
MKQVKCGIGCRLLASLIVASSAVIAIAQCWNTESSRCLEYNVDDCWKGWSNPDRYYKLISASYAYKPDQLVNSTSGWFEGELTWDKDYQVTTSGTVGVYLSKKCTWGYIGTTTLSRTCYGAYVPNAHPTCSVIK